MLAYDYPMLGIFWSLFIFTIFVLWVFTFIWCFIDNFRRHDHSGGAKALWFIVLLVLPFLGVLIYVISRPADLDIAA